MILRADTRHDVRSQARLRLAQQLESFSLSELRWDWGCNISPDTRALIEQELRCRGVIMEHFEALGRGRRRGGEVYRP